MNNSPGWPQKPPDLTVVPAMSRASLGLVSWWLGAMSSCRTAWRPLPASWLLASWFAGVWWSVDGAVDEFECFVELEFGFEVDS